MRRRTRAMLVVPIVLTATACSADSAPGDSTPDDDCTSSYEDIAQAPTRDRLDRFLTSKVDRSVVRLRVQGQATASGGDHQPAEIVDLLNARDRRVMQIEVFQLADGQWYAGRWSQCID